MIAARKPVSKIVYLSIDSIRPAPENEKIYRPISPTDPDMVALQESVSKIGILDPLVVSIDRFIMSGHRRWTAAKMVGLKRVPCRIAKVRRTDPDFVWKLAQYNRQRVKTLSEIVREEVVNSDPEEAHRLLVEHRQEQSRIDSTGAIEIVGQKHRSKITSAKQPFLDAMLKILRERRSYWPLSIRTIHYLLLNDPPLIHAKKPKSGYRNNRDSYKAAIDLAARGRLAGLIPWEAIDDETRPITIWNVFDSVAPFIRKEFDKFLKDYYRNLQISQPNQIEIVGEKNTIASIIKPVAMEYCIPFTIGRGYSSLPPRKKMADRFLASGKEKLIVLVLSDGDPEGMDIPHSFARSMRDDFSINVTVIKVALTPDQAEEMNLHPNNLEEKKKGSRYREFVRRYGQNGYELEAAPPATLQGLLRQAIDSVLNVDAYNAEIDTEKKDAAHLDAMRRTIHAQLSAFDVDFDTE